MSHRGSEKTQVANVVRRKLGRGSVLRDPVSLPGGRSFQEDLALFERQVREEAGERAGRLAGRAAPAALSA